jgi:hypothetical protein
MDSADAADVTFAHGGRTVLALDKEVSRQLNDKTLDVKNTDKGPRLLFR